ncbi:hypothetical protein CYMTET_26757, partial [Cymbomonas tetramitiformis]
MAHQAHDQGVFLGKNTCEAGATVASLANVDPSLISRWCAIEPKLQKRLQEAQSKSRLGKKTNKKTKSTEERLPKIKRWHARLRLRLQTPQEGETVDPVWGVWLPNDRYNVDQIVPTEHVNHAEEHQVVAAGGLFMPKTLTSVALVTDEEATAVAMAVAEDAAIAEVENEDAEREEESLEEEDEEVFIVEKLGAIKWIN